MKRLSSGDELGISFDEAQHLGKVRGGSRLLDQLDYIKSLANTSGVKHVLFGTYQMLTLWNLSGQWARRSKIMHLPRYRMTVDAEVEMFEAIIETFEDNLPLPEKANLVEHWEDIYVRCAGCVGILKMWMHRVLAVALKENLPSMDYRLMRNIPCHQNSFKKSPTTLSLEKKLLDSDEGYKAAKLLLMRDPAKTASDESKKQEASKKPKVTKRRVGERKPGRV